MTSGFLLITALLFNNVIDPVIRRSLKMGDARPVAGHLDVWWFRICKRPNFAACARQILTISYRFVAGGFLLRDPRIDHVEEPQPAPAGADVIVMADPQPPTCCTNSFTNALPASADSDVP